MSTPASPRFDIPRILPIKILIADDEVSARTPLALVLEEHGFEVLQTGTVTEALGLLERHRSSHRPVSLLIIDAQFEGRQAAGLLEHLASCGLMTPSVLLRGVTDEVRTEELARLGCVKALTKPLEPEDVIMGVVEALSQVWPGQPGGPASSAPEH